MGKAQVHPEDRERKSLFYVLSGNQDLRTKDIKKIYDFKEGRLKIRPGEEERELPKLPEGLNLASSSRALLLLAVNLYNSSYESLSVSDTFRNLDRKNYLLALEAIKIRFEV